ncbi:phage holin family protein [Rhodobacteraceae bacterium NNCM2]|nr:phage holin family protein [Coraliihabitans acroporae]
MTLTAIEEKARRLGLRAAFYAASVGALTVSLGAVTVALAMGLAQIMPGWGVALVIAGLYGGAGGLLWLAAAPKPEKTPEPLPAHAVTDAEREKAIAQMTSAFITGYRAAVRAKQTA